MIYKSIKSKLPSYSASLIIAVETAGKENIRSKLRFHFASYRHITFRITYYIVLLRTNGVQNWELFYTITFVPSLVKIGIIL